MKTVEERFWAMVDKNGPVVRPELGPCWIWTGATNNRGYGVFNPGKAAGFRLVLAHRFALSLVTDLAATAKARYQCDVRRCVRQPHLVPGTQSENMRDAVERRRIGLDTDTESAPRRYTRSPRAYGAKIDFTVAEEIRRTYRDQRLYQDELAARFGISQQMISLILRNKAWMLPMTTNAQARGGKK